MDAKPQRFGYGFVHREDENLPPMTNKTLHQRHKSANNLRPPTNAMPNAVLTSNTMKSNGAGGLQKAKIAASLDGSKPVVKNSGLAREVVMAQENKAHLNPKDAFLRPAQRPPKSVASAASMQHSCQESQGQTQARPVAKSYTHKKRGAPIVVYSDNHREEENSDVEQSIPPQASRADIVKDDARQQDEGQNWIFVHAESSRAPLEGRLNDFHMYGSPAPSLHDGVSSAHRAEDDVTDAVYMDAVEEFPGENRAPSADSAPGYLEVVTGWQSPSLDGSDEDGELAAAKGLLVRVDLPDYEEDPADMQINPTSFVSADNQIDLSDYEDEDYDDQGYTTAHSGRDNTTGGVTMIMAPPKLTKKGVAEVEAAKELVERKYPKDVKNEEFSDIGMVAEYGDEIFAYMKEVEIELLPSPHYMDIQNDIHWSMRSVLIDWVVQVHLRFQLLPETLFLAVNYIDRFLSVKVVSMTKLQLVGATALLLAAKYEEINCPSVQEMVYMVDGGYSQADVLKAERFMLSMLGFALGWPGPMSFMRRISKADDYDSEIRTVAKYIIEVTLMDERFVASPPSYVAAGAQCLARMMLKKGDWTPEHVHYSGYTYTQLKPLIATMLECCRAGRKHHQAVYDKYTTRLFKRASIYVEEQIIAGFKLPFQHGMHHHTPRDLFEDMHPASLTLTGTAHLLG
ncbi:cyclin-like protein [Hypoxylon sp. FL0543]|nr:cyclin-like protein [Hypoxylon sp. FL0543]